jgi:glycosyltransferase involved in cell wall biosynthesis
MNRKIAIFGDDPTGPTGFGKIVKHLAAAVVAAGCQPIVVGLKQHYDNPIPGTKIINALENEDPQGFATLSGILKTEAIDIVISIGDPWDIQGLPQVKQKRPFTWIGYTPVDSTPYPRYILLSKEPHQYLDVAFLMPQMDHIVTYAGFGKTAVEEMLVKAGTEEPLQRQGGVQAIYLGVDPDLYRPQTKSKARKLFQGAMTDDMLLFSCMKVNSIRAGFDTLFAAWSAYLSLSADFDPALAERSKLYLHTAIDNGGYPISLLMQRYGLENSIMLNPGIKPGECFPEEVIAATHNASDIVVSAARGEGFGLNILEALSCAVPCVVPDYGCPAEYGGEAVWRVPIAATFNPEFATTDFAIVNENEMAAGMFALARAPEKRTRMGNIGREIAKTLTWQAFIDKWAAKLEGILRRT